MSFSLIEKHDSHIHLAGTLAQLLLCALAVRRSLNVNEISNNKRSWIGSFTSNSNVSWPAKLNRLHNRISYCSTFVFLDFIKILSRWAKCNNDYSPSHDTFDMCSASKGTLIRDTYSGRNTMNACFHIECDASDYDFHSFKLVGR